MEYIYNTACEAEIPRCNATWHAIYWYLQSSQFCRAILFLCADWLYTQEWRYRRPLMSPSMEVQKWFPLYVLIYIKIYFVFQLNK